MSPWAEDTDWRRNWRFVIIMVYMTAVALAGAYGLFKLQQYSDDNRVLIQRVDRQQRAVKNLSALSDFKLCRSVLKGKNDRIDEYRFTLAQTEKFYRDNPALPKENLKLTQEFYHKLIQRTKMSIVKCPPLS